LQQRGELCVLPHRQVCPRGAYFISSLIPAKMRNRFNLL
jgi:hypothetical protein